MAEISHNSRRVAKNTLLLYMRMLLMMAIGLFTSRVVLQALGVEDFGTYTAVYEMVMLFSIISNGVSNAISRFLAYETGRSDSLRQQKVFSAAIIIQAMMSIALVIIALTAGLWYLRCRMILPEGRLGAATWAMLCSVVMMTVQLFSIPFNATLYAHEDMKAFAYISILEALLKLCVALGVMFCPWDKLVCYAVMMAAVAFVIRSTYAIYCRKHFPQTCGHFIYDAEVLRSMLNLSGWSMLGGGVGVLNSKGMSLVANSFFGVGINAARGIASQVENIVKQFVSNFLTALNPQITKSWASGDEKYCHELVIKGCKYSYLMMLLFTVPFVIEADQLLHLWLGNVPEYAADFTRLVLICLMMEMMVNSLFQLVLSTGKVAAYYIITSAILLAAFIGSHIAFSMGADPRASYVILIGAYAIADIAKLILAKRIGHLKIREFFKEAVLGCTLVTLNSIIAGYLPVMFMQQGIARLVSVVAASTAAMAITAWSMALTDGERQFIKEYLRKTTGVWKRKF